MPTNETIVAVPLSVENPGQTRQFLLRLVEKLDIVLGYRGEDPYVSISQLQDVQNNASSGLTQLEQTIIDTINENSEAVAAVLTTTSEQNTQAIESLKSSSSVSNADDSTQTISAAYTQIEVQNIQDQVVDVASKLNSLLAALRGTEIIAT